MLNNTVKALHLKKLLSPQQNLEFKLAPKLTPDYLDTKKHFLKMRVSSATNVFNNETSSALKFLAEEHSKEAYYTIAWFVDFIFRWFKIITARHPAFGLGKKHGICKSYENARAHLKETIQFFSLVNVGKKNQWKPFQSSVVISTTSFLEVSEYLLNERDFKFVLGSRFTQDCLENVFSVVRSKNEVPNCLQFKNNILLISISQYMKNVSSGSYDEDDRTFLSEFLDILQNVKNNTDEQNDSTNKYQTLNIPHINIVLKNIELNGFYYIAGYIRGNISKNKRTCYDCLKFTGSKTPKICHFSKLIRIKKKSIKDTLFFVNDTTFNYFLSMEKIFRAYYKTICSLHKKLNVKQFLYYCTFECIAIVLLFLIFVFFELF